MKSRCTHQEQGRNQPSSKCSSADLESSVRAQEKCSGWSSNPWIQDPSTATTKAAEKARTAMQSSAVPREYATSTTRQSGDAEDGQSSFFSYRETATRMRSQTEQEEKESRGSDYVLVDPDVYSGTLGTEYINDLDFWELDDRSDGERSSPADFEHPIFERGTTCESGIEGVGFSFARKEFEERSLPSWAAERNHLYSCGYGTELSGGQKIIQWLPHEDPSSNHNLACQKRLQSTCSWILNTPHYADWQSTSNSLLWLHGIGRSIHKTLAHFRARALSNIHR